MIKATQFRACVKLNIEGVLPCHLFILKATTKNLRKISKFINHFAIYFVSSRIECDSHTQVMRVKPENVQNSQATIKCVTQQKNIKNNRFRDRTT